MLYSIHGDENRENVPLDQISPYASKAVMAIEDDQFYEHMGIDIPAIGKAFLAELGLGNARGGSTLTQQYIKNAFLSSERTYSRKLKEIILSLQLESKYDKDQIMEFYLNRIPYGASIYGVEVASKTFFDKPAVELTLVESAILAAIPKAPTFYSPYGNHRYAQIDLDELDVVRLNIRSEQDLVDYDPNMITKGLLGKTYTFGEEGDEYSFYMQGRTDFVLKRMLELQYITQEQFDEAVLEAENLEFNPFREDITAPHFVMYIREQLEEKYGKELVEKGGFQVTTTLNPLMQEAAEKAVENQAESNELNFKATNASVVAVDPNTGEIMAMVGSSDYWNDDIDGKVNIALRPRLPGSSFKPIVYASAFLQGYAPGTVLYDVKTTFGTTYSPDNFDGEFRGPVSLRNALGASLNIHAVKAGFLAGIPNVLDLARAMGIGLDQSDDWYGLSLALGAGEARPLDMATAYSTFANGGFETEAVSILMVQDRYGNILEEYEVPEKKDQILDPQVAYLINDILSDPEARPDPYWRNRLTIPGHVNGAKTGTSNNPENKQGIIYPKDTWTIGYTRDLVGAVWAGNANGDPLSLYASGLDAAGKIWREFMIEATKEHPRKEFDKPEGIHWRKISKRSGKSPSEHTLEEDIISDIFASFSKASNFDDSYRFVKLDKVSGKLATEWTPLEAIEEKAFYTHHSILPDNSKWEAAVRAWAEENGEDQKAPEEFDDIHTQESMKIKPDIRITSPGSNEVVAPPHLGVWVDIDSNKGIERVDYYWDGEFVHSAEISPYKGNITIPNSLKKGSKHTLSAMVFDQWYRSNKTTIQVEIGEDDTDPVANIVYPKEWTLFSPHSFITAQVNAKDIHGDILKVDFYLNDELINSSRIPPYSLQFKLPEELGEHELKIIAFDHARNSDEDNIMIEISDSASSTTGNSRMLSPKSGSNFDANDSILVKAFIGEGDQDGLESVVILAKPKKGAPLEVGSIDFTENPSSHIQFIWNGAFVGEYQLYMKMMLEGGKTRFSERVDVEIE